MSELDDVLMAIYRGNLKGLEKFTSEQLNARDQDGRTPLMHAVLAENADPALVKFLIARGADVNATDNDQRWTALHFAARDQKEEVVRALLDAGANIDPVDVFGNTPLWRAVMNASSNLSVIQELIKRGAKPHKKNSSDVAPIDIAKQSGRDDIVVVLEKK